jgi:hypothetical protein
MSRPQHAQLSVQLGACFLSIVILRMPSNNGMALPKAVVRSWSRIEPKPAEKQPAGTASHGAKPNNAPQAVLTRWGADLQVDWLRQQCSLPN